MALFQKPKVTLFHLHMFPFLKYSVYNAPLVNYA